MTEQKKLRELQNNVRIVGTLKDVELEVKPKKDDPKIMQIMGHIVVITQDLKNNRVNEHRVNLFAKHTSKLYKGYMTIKNEYKQGDRISVVGSIDENVYMGGDQELKQFNRIRGLFVNRVTEADIAKNPALANDEALFQAELLVEKLHPLTDSEGVETGEYRIDAYSVGYNNGVNKIHQLVVGQDLADVITENYENNSTGMLTFQINNYAEVEETEEQEPVETMQGGFGVQVDISEGPVTKYVNELRLIGGFPPYYDERALDEDDIKLAKQIHNLKVNEVKNSVPATPPVGSQGQGFGVNNQDPFANDGQPIDISDDDLPF